uniref:Uncharacterized protein n=1 Tax=Pavo cristatus TaxID=9049 RepID=A0A8C9F0X5_PAVCR
MDHVGTADAEDDPGSLPRLAPSPHSEAVAHEFKELSLQPSQCLPPLNERKNGDVSTVTVSTGKKSESKCRLIWIGKKAGTFYLWCLFSQANILQ